MEMRWRRWQVVLLLAVLVSRSRPAEAARASWAWRTRRRPGTGACGSAGNSNPNSRLDPAATARCVQRNSMPPPPPDLDGNATRGGIGGRRRDARRDKGPTVSYSSFADARRRNRGSQPSGMGDGDEQHCCEGVPFERPSHSLSFAQTGLLQMEMSLLAVDSLRPAHESAPAACLALAN
jgi:hypothetical protein